jgi:iron transport multicopper oxidase
VNVQSLVVDTLQIFAGQRYSFILTANQPVNNYWIHSIPTDDTTFNGSAILRYAGAPVADPTTTFTPQHPLLETNLHPLANPGAPGSPHQGSADIAFTVNIAVNPADGRYTVNGAEYSPPTVPVLLQIFSGARTAQDLLPAGSVYTLPRNKVIEVSVPGGSTDSPVCPFRFTVCKRC